MPIILVKCVNSQTGAQRIDTFHYRETFIAQILTTIIGIFSVWAVIISTVPIIPSLLLIYLLYRFRRKSRISSLTGNEYHRVIKVDWPLREWMLQVYFGHSLTWLIWRHQLLECDYKQLIVNLNDEKMDVVWIKKSTH